MASGSASKDRPPSGLRDRNQQKALGTYETVRPAQDERRNSTQETPPHPEEGNDASRFPATAQSASIST